MAAPDDALFDALIAALREEFGSDLLGVLVTGSHIHGDAGPTSDLDVHVLIAGARRQRRNRRIGDLEVEMFLNPPFQIHRYFAESRADGRGVDQHMFAYGRVIYDPGGVVAALQEESRLQWEAGPPPVRAADVWPIRYGPADLLRDLEDVGGKDEAAGALLAAQLVERLVSSHYRLNRRWSVKLKRCLADLGSWDVRAAELARGAVAARTPAERTAALKELADHVLAPVGGLMPIEWETEWEALKES